MAEGLSDDGFWESMEAQFSDVTPPTNPVQDGGLELAKPDHPPDTVEEVEEFLTFLDNIPPDEWDVGN